MSSERSPLPQFDKPPVVELALSIKFVGIDLKSGHTGLLWNKFRRGFPNVEDQPELDVAVESETPQLIPGFQQIQFGPPRVRAWFVNEAGTELLQVQHDLFACNWRRNNTQEPYPSFRATCDRFRNDVGTFEEFIREYRLGNPTPVQCEVSYINHIAGAGVWERHSDQAKVFTVWARREPGFLPEASDANVAIRYRIPDHTGAFVGRLHVSTQPVFAKKPNSEQLIPLFVTTLTARGRPIGEGFDGVFAFFETGHEWIVRGFAELTTPEMHKAWGRIP